jgi:ATP-binding cassette subfamily C (CFTR/MRP) protein 4
MDEKVRKSVPNPFVKANVISKTLLFFISPLLTLGKQRPLREDDLADPCQSDESKRLTEQLEREWTKELKKKNPSLFYALVRVFWLKIAYVTLFLAAEETVRMILPLLIAKMLKYFDSTHDIYYALRYAIYISLGVTFNSIIHHPFFLNVSRTAVKFRVALSGLVYKKVISILTSISTN